MEKAVERWQAIIDARATQMDAAYAELGRSSAGYWDRRARRYHDSTKNTVASDPFFNKLRSVVTPQTSVLDVGSGSGRFALALAPLVKQVIAVEPDAAMLDYLSQDAHTLNLSNISYSRNTWLDAPYDLHADIVICSHVLYPIRDIVPFLAKLQHAARQKCYIYMRATPIDALTAHLWKHFHGDERFYPPCYIHALDVLYEMGIFANVEMVTLPGSLRYPSLDDAVEELTELLILSDDEKTRGELRDMLASWLVERDGMLIPPPQEMACAIIWWTS